MVLNTTVIPDQVGQRQEDHWDFSLAEETLDWNRDLGYATSRTPLYSELLNAEEESGKGPGSVQILHGGPSGASCPLLPH